MNPALFMSSGGSVQIKKLAATMAALSLCLVGCDSEQQKAVEAQLANMGYVKNEGGFWALRGGFPRVVASNGKITIVNVTPVSTCKVAATLTPEDAISKAEEIVSKLTVKADITRDGMTCSAG